MKKLRKKLRKLKKATNWNNFKIIYKLLLAKLSGVSVSKYLKNKAYNLDNKSLKKLGKQIKKKNKIIKEIKHETGFSEKEILKKASTAKELGISLYRYNFYRCFELTKEEQEDLAKTLKKRDLKKELNKKWYMNVIREKTGCDVKEALEKLDIAKSKKYNYYNFITSGNYALPLEDLEKIPNYKKKKVRTTDTNKKIKKELSNDKEKIKKEMNWNEGQFKLNYLKAQVNCGCNMHEYYIFKLYKLSLKAQKDYITSELWHKLYVRYCDYADTWKYFKQKPLFNEKFKKFVKRDWRIVESLSYKDFKEFIKNKDSLIYKPLDTACGIGIKKFPIRKSILQNIYLYIKLKMFREGIIEEIIKQNKDMAKLNSSTINTIRVQTITLNDKTHFLNATVRMGASKKSTTDNFSSGGVMANVDLKTGKVIGNASSKFGGIIKKHPESNIKFNGFQIPCWDKVLKTVEEACKVVKTMPYIGWDVVINEDNTIQLIEGNHDGDATLHQYCPAVTENKGIRTTIDKYIWFDEKDKTV